MGDQPLPIEFSDPAETGAAVVHPTTRCDNGAGRFEQWWVDNVGRI